MGLECLLGIRFSIKQNHFHFLLTCKRVSLHNQCVQRARALGLGKVDFDCVYKVMGLGKRSVVQNN